MIILHGVALSPFVRKAMLALEYKDLAYENIPVFPGSDDAGFRALSPLGKIPVLEHDDFAIPDTSVICRYLDRVFPDKPLYPTDPVEEARACWLEEFADSKLIEALAGLFQQRFLNPKMFGTPTDESVVASIIEQQLPPLLSYLESVTPEAGPLVGDTISIADIAVVTCFLQGRYGEYEVDASDYPRLKSYLDRSLSNELVINRMKEEQKVVEGLAA